MPYQVNGTLSSNVDSERAVAVQLEQFGKQVQEALLVDGRMYNLRLSFTAFEPSDEGGDGFF